MTADSHRGDFDDHRLAAELATEAGTLLLELCANHQRGRASGADDLQSLRDGGDRLSHEFLAGALARVRPGDAVLSEEAPDDRRRLGRRRVWIIDPLDGTRQFGEPGRADWAVHVALVIDGAPLVGAVALPADGLTLSTWRRADPAEPSAPDAAPTGPVAVAIHAEGRQADTTESPVLRPAPEASLDGCFDGYPSDIREPQVLASAAGGERRRVITSRSRHVPEARAVAAALGAELIRLGSVGAKVAAVIRGRADAYVHAGGQSEWDSAAPVAVALAAGLHASRLDGRLLQYNQPNVELPDLLICRPELAPAALAAAAPAAAPR